MLIERGLQAFLRRYAGSEVAAVTPFLQGRRILDLGAGEGYVGPFRRVEGVYVTYDGSRLPFRDAAFETTLLLLTLHHCVAPETVLDEAVRVTRRRLIVLESVYRNWRERFWLDLLDGKLNRYRHNGQMPVALAFRPPQKWEQLFASRRLKLVETHWLGSWWERLVHHPVLFVCDKTREILSPRG
jgi:SAM-dependent methyltransferase